MSLATIIKKIDEEAIAQSQDIIEQARVEDGQIIAYARLKAEEEAESIIRHNKEELQTLKSKQMATTLLHMRKEKLDNRQRILKDVFSKALSQISSYDEDKRRAMIKTILLSVTEERQGTILLSKADKPLIDAQFVEDINKELELQHRKLRFTLSNNTADIDRGFVVDFNDFDINYSIEKVLSGLWEEIKGEVSKRLFEGENKED